MNSPKRLMDDERGLRHVSLKKKKRVARKPFHAGDGFYGLFRLVEEAFNNGFEDFVLDDWKSSQRRNIRGSGISRLESWLEQGLHDTLYARRILRKSKR